MTGESTNLPFGGSDSAHPSTALDNPENLNFYEPGEDDELDNQEVQDDGADPDREPDETNEDGQEADTDVAVDENEGETQGDEAEAQPSEVADDVLVSVNGQPLPFGELKAGYLRQADYSRKTQELGNRRRDLDALTARVNHSVHAIADFLSQQVPAEPHPSLAMTDPARFVREKAVHDNAMMQLQTVLSATGELKNVGSTLTNEQHQELLAQESAKLAQAFPHITKPGEQQKFFNAAFETAREIGFSEDEMNVVTDYRMFKLAHYARLGMEAEKARAKARTKVASVPPVAPNKRPQGSNPSRARANQEAMKRLSQTGSIHDAVKIDFD
ncbi:MAG: hypothetical protein QHC90_25300 [Shinella sp.]|nr:hypothetical protein [Shinella sp.]